MQASASENTWLRPSPDARPDRQVLVGDPFQVDHVRDGHAFGHALKDGYAGCLPEQTLGAVIVPTHWVSVRSTWGYKAPDIKSALVSDLHMTTRLHTVAESDRWLEVQHRDGRCFVPKHHCRDWLDWHRNPVDVARQYLGAPYVWAGNTGFGLDCSGLIQAVYHAIGWSCAADSQDQKDMPGTRPDEHQPGDLIFWKDHVALETGEGTLIHANAHHMQVTEEPRHAVIARIASTSSGQVTARLRPLRRPLAE